MQSLASLMSLKQSDIGNLDDFNDSDEDEDKRLSTTVKMATAVKVAVSVPQRPCGGLVDYEQMETSGSAEDVVTPHMLPITVLPGLAKPPIPLFSAQSYLLPDGTQTATLTVARGKSWRTHSFPSFWPSPTLDSTPSDFGSSSYDSMNLSPAWPSKMYCASLNAQGFALRTPTSMPSAKETASWQKEWRSPNLKPTLCPALPTSEHINPVQDLQPMCHQASAATFPPAQTPSPMHAPLPALSSSHVKSPPPVYLQKIKTVSVTPNSTTSSIDTASPKILNADSACTSLSQTLLSASISPLPASFTFSSIASAMPSSSSSAFLDAPLCSSPDVGPVVHPPVVSESEKHRQLSVLTEEEYPNTVCSGKDDADTNLQNHEPNHGKIRANQRPNISTEKLQPVFGLEVVRPAKGTKSMSNSPWPTSGFGDDTAKNHMGDLFFDKVLIKQEVSIFPSVNKKKNTEEEAMKSVALVARCFEDVSSVPPVPSMMYLLPACPKTALVPGMASIAFPERMANWSWVKSEKIQKMCIKKNKPREPMDVEWAFYNTNTTKNMMLLHLACPRTANIPGFPSLLYHMEQSGLWTCPKVSLDPSSSLRYPIMWSDKGCSKENVVLWERHFGKSKEQSLLISSMKGDLETAENMAALTVSCSAASKLSGFPCVPKPSTASMFRILPCCPKVSYISGFQSAKFYNSTQNIADMSPSNNKIIAHKNQSYLRVLLSQEVIDQLRDMENIKPFCLKTTTCHSIYQCPVRFKFTQDKSAKNSTALLIPSCSRQARIPGFPCAPWLTSETQIMSGIQSACPLKSKASGIPSLHLSKIDKALGNIFSANDKVILVRKCLIEKPIYPPEELRIACFKGMHYVLPNCAPKAGCPSAQKDPLMVYLSYSCPTVSIVAGMLSGNISKEESQWFVKATQLGDKHLKGKMYHHIHSVSPQFKEIKDEVIKRDMLAIGPSCATSAKLPGFPSAPELNKSISTSMISTIAHCPCSTKISGIQSVNLGKETVDSSAAWPLGEIISPLYKIISKDESKMEGASSFNMDQLHFHIATLPSCARESIVPGFPPTYSSLHSAQVVGYKQETLLGLIDVKTDLPNPNKADQEKTNENMVSSICEEGQKGLLEKRCCRMWHSVPVMPLLLTVEERFKCISAQIPPSSTCKENYRDTLAENDEVDKGLLQTSNKSSNHLIYELQKEENTTDSLVLYTVKYQTGVQQGCIPNMTDLLPTCPMFSEIFGCPVTCLSSQYETIKWPIDVNVIWEKTQKHKSTKNVLLMPYLEKSLSGLPILYSCQNKSRIPGFASAKRTTYLGTHSRIKLCPSCPEMSIVIGTPSQFIVPEDMYHGEWHSIKTSFLEEYTIPKLILNTEITVVLSEVPAMIVAMVPSCPNVTLIYGFPSALNSKEICIQPCEESSQDFFLSTNPKESAIAEMKSNKGENKTPHETLNLQSQRAAQMLDSTPVVQIDASMLEILPSCPLFSRICGCPSLRDLPGNEWIVEKSVISCGLLKKIPAGILDTGKNVSHSKCIAMTPTCPQASSIPGFPSRPHPIEEMEPRMQNIYPSYPMISYIAGCQSIQTPNTSKWPIRTAMMCSNQSKLPVVVDMDTRYTKNIYGMFAFASTCPSVVCAPGFPSLPKPIMLCILPTCPEKSKIIGFSSKEESEYLDRSIDKKTLYSIPLKNKSVAFVERLDWINDLSKITFPLAPTCPLQTRIPGFPYAPEHNGKIPPKMTNLHQCVPKMSKIIGFSSSERINTRLWPNGEKSLLEKPLKTKPELHFQFSVDLPFKQIDRCILQKMFSLVPICPREACIQGFPSLPHVKLDGFYLNKEPDIVILLHSCPRLSFKVGIPSVSSVSIEESQVSMWSSLKIMWFKALKERPVLSFGNTNQYGENLQTMVLLAPICPDKAQSYGFSCSERPKKEHTVTSILPPPPEAPLPATDEILFNNMITERQYGPVKAALGVEAVLDVPDSTISLTSLLGSPNQHIESEGKFTQQIESETDQMRGIKETDKTLKTECFNEVPLFK
ncbi:hypothetical protein IRJ41_001007, partial [Triplophysa rosa]